MLPLVFRALVVGLLIESVLFAQDATTFVSTKSDPANFIVRTFPGGPKASVVLDQCEDLRAELQRSWLRLETADKWEPQCEIVLHPDRTQYLKAVGVGGGSTSGSSLVRSKHGRITARRIDLIVNQDGELTALAHELTHVVLADRFEGRTPRWIDEGIATRADSPEKRSLHLRDCLHSIQSGTALRLFEVFKLEQFTSAQQVPAFYGQSLSLISFLSAHDEPAKIITFAEKAKDIGYDRALKVCYGMEGIPELERKWRAYVLNGKHGHTDLSAVATGRRS